MGNMLTWNIQGSKNLHILYQCSNLLCFSLLWPGEIYLSYIFRQCNFWMIFFLRITFFCSFWSVEILSSVKFLEKNIVQKQNTNNTIYWILLNARDHVLWTELCPLKIILKSKVQMWWYLGWGLWEMGLLGVFGMGPMISWGWGPHDGLGSL